MSHVDEGALHAYLDGALDEYPVAEAERIREHLDECAECARRLEEERAIRSDAHAILGMAAPEVELPSFEELRAYVERTRPRGGSIPKRAYRMRMAASVALALGTGWMLRGGLPGAPLSAPESAAETMRAGTEAGGVASPQAADRAEAEPQTQQVAAFDDESPVVAQARSDAAAEDAAQDRSVVARAGLPAEPDAGAGGGASIGPARPAVAEIRSVPAEELRALPEAEIMAAEVDVVAEKMAEADESAAAADPAESSIAGLSSVTADADAATDDAIAMDAPTESEAAAEDLALDEATATDVVAALPEPAAPPADADAGADDESRSEEERARRTRSAGPPVTSAMERNTFGSRRAVPDDLEPVTDIPALSVAGYDVVAVTSLGEGTAPVGTHVVQRFEDGETFEIFHLEPEVSRDVVPMPGTGTSEVEVLTEGGWIVLQGPRSTEELGELLTALFPTG